MSAEAPLITKALRLVSLALIISTVALAASAGYSAYQEYNAIASLGGSQSQLHESFNGTTMTLSGLTIPNNMSYPLSLELLGTITLENVHLANFASPAEVIQPGQAKPLSLSIGLDLTSALTNQSVLRTILFNQFHVGLNTTISTSVIPLIGLNISKSMDQVYPPLIGNLSTSLNTASVTNSSQSIFIPLVLSWNNQSPLILNGSLVAVLTGVPGFASGNYGNGTAPFAVNSGLNQDILTLAIPKSGPLGNQVMATGKFPSGNYTFSLSFAAYGVTVPFQENVTVP